MTDVYNLLREALEKIRDARPAMSGQSPAAFAWQLKEIAIIALSDPPTKGVGSKKLNLADELAWHQALEIERLSRDLVAAREKIDHYIIRLQKCESERDAR